MTSQSSTPIPALFAYLLIYNNFLNMLNILISFLFKKYEVHCLLKIGS